MPYKQCLADAWQVPCKHCSAEAQQIHGGCTIFPVAFTALVCENEMLTLKGLSKINSSELSILSCLVALNSKQKIGREMACIWKNLFIGTLVSQGTTVFCMKWESTPLWIKCFPVNHNHRSRGMTDGVLVIVQNRDSKETEFRFWL